MITSYSEGFLNGDKRKPAFIITGIEGMRAMTIYLGPRQAKTLMKKLGRFMKSLSRGDNPRPNGRGAT